MPPTPNSSVPWPAVVDRVLALVGDALAVGVVLLAVYVGALDRPAGIAVVGWMVRALVNPTTTLSSIAAGVGAAFDGRGFITVPPSNGAAAPAAGPPPSPLSVTPPSTLG